MRKTSLLFAALVLAAAAGGQPQPDLIARIHFAGAAQISADPNHLAFTNEFCSAEARALESQTLDRLSRVPGGWFKSKIPAGAGDGAAQLRPLLDDFLKSEWIFEMRNATNGSPEYALAIRLSPERAQSWSKNLAAVLQGWTGIAISQDKSGIWELKKHEPPNRFQFSRAGDWVIIDCGQDKLFLHDEIAAWLLAKRVEEAHWLAADLNWPRLAQLFPALQDFDFPKIQMQAIGRGGNLQLTGKLTLAQPLPVLQPWRVPNATIHQPLVSFTAARGVGPWLTKQSWMQPLSIQPQPDQFFIWAMGRIPFQTYAAGPVPDAKSALAQLYQRLSADTGWQGHFFSPVMLAMTNNEISLGGLPPLISPFVQALHGPAGDFLVGGFFPNPLKGQPPSPELLAPLNQPNLVYYHWENTAGRLNELPPQMTQLLLVVMRHEQLKVESAAGKWLARIGPTLGDSVTEVTQTAPNELAFKRTAQGALTAIELLAFVDWLEAPGFPALDLRLPPPRVRPGQRPFGLQTAPPAAPVPAPGHP